MRYLGSSVARNRNAQLAHLERTIGRDLGYLLATLQGRARTFLHQEGDSTLTPIARCLEEFDKASSNLRGQYRDGVSDLLSRRSEEAWNSLEGRLKQNHEGIRNKVSRILDTATETQQKIRDDISGAWNAPNTPILDGVAKLIGDVVGRKLGAISVPALAQAMQDSAKASLPVRLGYVDEKHSPVAWRVIGAKRSAASGACARVHARGQFGAGVVRHGGTRQRRDARRRRFEVDDERTQPDESVRGSDQQHAQGSGFRDVDRLSR
jgi:hypothetical protein